MRGVLGACLIMLLGGCATVIHGPYQEVRIDSTPPGATTIVTAQIVASYDWLWAPLSCSPCEAVGELPTYDMHAHALPVRFVEAAFYEYPKGAVGAFGRGLRIFSPDALLGSAFKLKPATGGYWSDWSGLETPEVQATLEPLS